MQIDSVDTELDVVLLCRFGEGVSIKEEKTRLSTSGSLRKMK